MCASARLLVHGRHGEGGADRGAHDAARERERARGLAGPSWAS
jgi:hypothetical protein